jgi:hypothetical protein
VLFVPTVFVVVQRFENWLAARRGQSAGRTDGVARGILKRCGFS